MKGNKLLSSMADLKSHHASSCGTSFHSGKSVQNHHKLRLKHRRHGRDTEAGGEIESISANDDMEASSFAAPLRHDGIYEMGSTIVSYESPKKLEPTPLRHDDPSAYSDMGSTILSHELPLKLEP